MYYVPRRDLPLSHVQKRGDERHLTSYHQLKRNLDVQSQLQISQHSASQRAERTMLERAIDCLFIWTVF